MDLISVILALCAINSVADLNNDRHATCMDYYINCVVQKNGTYTDKDINKCIKDKQNVDTEDR